jgi:hypothetical protein
MTTDNQTIKVLDKGYVRLVETLENIRPSHAICNLKNKLEKK